MNTALVVCLSLALFGFVQSTPLKVVDGKPVGAPISYQAHLYLRSDFVFRRNCSGVLISENYVLTNSKCVTSGPTRVNVTLGVNNVRKDAQQAIYATRRWNIYYPNFDSWTMANNIALIKLPSAAKLSDDVTLAKLATTDNVKVGQTGTISGWGVNGSGVQTVINIGSVKVVANSVCAATYPFPIDTGDNTICVEGINGASACNGDGGAPLVIDGVVVGVYSGGPAYISGYDDVSDCSGKPNIFTKVANYMDWIKANSDL